MSKFKIGDKVKIARLEKDDSEDFLSVGEEGHVICYWDSDDEWIIGVYMDDMDMNLYIKEGQLELV